VPTPRPSLRGGLGVLAIVAITVAGLSAVSPVTAAPHDTVGGPDLAATGVVVHPLAGATALPKVDADTWVVADLTTGDVLAAKGAHTPVLPASTLKTLTAVALMPLLNKNQVVTASDKATRADGSHVGLVSGASYTIWDLWHGLLLPSANDAAFALAEANGGMVATIRAMQAKAIELGAHDTIVKSDSGLDHPGQVTSAYDMALFARAALAVPDFATVTKTLSYDFPGTMPATGGKRGTYKIYTQNRLLLHGFPGTIGGKTGFTSLAHRTFWAAAQRGGHTLVVTLFQIHEPTETAAKALLTWGFANRAHVSPVGTLVEPAAEGAPSASPNATSTDGSATTGDAAHGTTSVSFAALPKRGLLIGIGVLAALVAGGWWWWRRRDTAPVAPLVPTTSAPRSAPTSTARPTTSGVTVVPVGASSITTPTAATSVAATEQTTLGATSVTTSEPWEPGHPDPVVDVTGHGIDDTSPIPVVEAPVPPARSGNVRVVRPGRAPQD
jgi:D-alanyl-D-alanine carboxypeptidase (penicillin-binding protein 5/6)